MKIFPKIFAQVESFYYFCTIFCKTMPVMGLFAIGIYIIDKGKIRGINGSKQTTTTPLV